ncbi:ubiquitin-activating enzyme E1 [Thecamonas trahens ATCC 50062]|uniref:E1 ubiquitin-activating enzyme n=1 Tax=Thecamonas trahens ATCC 50062 TaxID=461836 RepID=A0A0L0DMQ1_THETB|nr:ubiquitin-activating enzyme E1 [Thecamonas trahens ATCC 50062]KNC53555.1 ubiquitin-activating enzyme E1 [Thecamonas trahens ATCC 50062]|eukprot:XP_013761874.1 ubiquitin-activating enzyme E1 [Thecamonas trahens ATCC 50062]
MSAAAASASNAGASNAGGNVEIDEDLQSRQLAVYGREAMMRLAKSKVLITGMDGLGAEIAKNVILANVGSVTLHDTAEVAIADLGAHFYLKEEDVGKNRAEACLGELQELNPSVMTVASQRDLEPKFLAEFQIVVCVSTPLAEACRINEYCRSARPPIAFVYTSAYGLAGAAFSDFGPDFPVFDWSGEAKKSAIVAKISQANPAVVTCVFDKNDPHSRHDLAEGEVVEFAEVKGMTELNGNAYTVKEVINPWMFSIEVDTTGFGEYFDGGLVTEKRMPRFIPFRSLRETLHSPGEFLVSDWGKWGRPALLHLALQALDAYRTEHGGAYPAPGDAAAGDAVVAAATELNAAKLADLDAEAARLEAQSKALGAALDAMDAAALGLDVEGSPEAAAGLSAARTEVEAQLKAVRDRQGAMGWERIDEVDEATLRSVASGSSAVLNAMAAFLGGLVGQEVVKAGTSKYMPLNQWYHFDALESLPAEAVDPASLAPRGSRYDAMTAVYGAELVEKIRNLKYFLVGSGALGCEYLKNFALTGVGTGPDGEVIVTDDDVIERSNLSRQFLFRNWHVKKSKSLSASEAAMAMNPEFKVKALQERVSPDTENIFNDAFWSSLSGVCNALDNIKARLYVDERCVFYGKSLLESGTLGPKCNTQVVVPHLTENYGASRDPPEREAPQCTIHNFPHTIEHCLVWAKSEFTGLFETSPAEAQKVLDLGSVDAYVETMQASGAGIGDILNNLRGDETWGGGVTDMLNDVPASYDDCVKWARHKWQIYASNMIRLLIHVFPEDMLTSEGGRFWTAPKRFPTPLEFDLADDMTFQFLRAASLLRASTFGINKPASVTRETIAAALASYSEPAFDPAALGDVKIESDPNAEAGAAEGTDDDISTVVAAIAPIPEVKAKTTTLYPEVFEKDDDTNHHIAFIQALGCLRARAYAIAEVDMLKAKLLAGNIIPAIATATAMAAGCCMFELVKLAQGLPVDAYRNSFFNLGVMAFSAADPMPPAKITSRQETIKPDPENYPDYEEERDIIAFPDPHTAWDAVVIDIGAAGTVADVLAYFDSHNLSVMSIAVNGGLIYRAGASGDAVKGNVFVDHVAEKVGADASRGFVVIEPLCEGADMQEIEFPPLVLVKVSDGYALSRTATTSMGKPVDA